MVRLKWLFWKALAWLTKPWRPKEVIDNPRSKKRREPAWYVFCLRLMYGVNALTVGAIYVSFVYLCLR